MRERPANLPDYHAPPIDEVAISVQFPPINGFFDTHAGLFWQRVRDDYPRSESQPRLEQPIESAEPGQIVPVQLQLSPGQGRVWLISANDDFLIQIQNTRFVQNWRRREAEYVHFDQIEDLFWTHYRELLSFLDEEKLEAPTVQQVEVSYINWIPDFGMPEFLRPASTSRIASPSLDEYPDQQSWIARYSLPSQEGLIQRLYVQCLPATHTSDPAIPGAQLALIFRAARREGIGTAELEELIAAARIIIVTAFTDLTTPAAHERWERFQ